MNHSHQSLASWGTRAAWLAAFVLATALFSVGLTCAVPLIAFAAICALRQSRGQALLFVGVLWLATELIGFLGLTPLSFPIGWVAFGWAALIGAAILAATWSAHSVARRIPGAGGVVATFVAAFGVYESVLWAVSRLLGAAAQAFTVGILTQVLALNAAMFAALLLVGALTSRAGRTPPVGAVHSQRRLI